MKNLLSTATIILLTAALAGCGGGGGGISGTPTAPPTLTAVMVTPGNPSIAPVTTEQFTAWGIYSNNTKVNLTTSATWSSSDTAIASISAQGLATAESNTGSTIITAVYSTITGSTVLTTSPVTTLSVTPSNPQSIAPNMSLQFSALGTLENSAIQNLTSWATWTSSNMGIATVGISSGIATAVAAPGSATISAMFSGITATSQLSTSPVATISTSPGSTSIAKGTSKEFTASGTLADNTTLDLTTWATWTSSVPGIASVSNTAGSKGLVTSLATGTTLITATFDSVVSSPVSTLVVTQATLVSLVIAPTSTITVLGKTRQFTATGTFTDTSTQDITASVTWASSNEAVALISDVTGSKGLATSKAMGTTTITASLSGITNNASLTVTPAELVSLEVTPLSASIILGATQQFTAMGTYSDGTFKDLTKSAQWVSSDKTVAAMSVVTGFEGVAITLSGGNTNITAVFSGVTSNNAALEVRFF
ncbi:MAG: Ig-like domain-containing protein [Nitrospirota bacterium]